MNRNYSKELDALIEKNKRENIKPKLMLHACCACCASYVLEYLSEHFEIYLLFYNPNITSEEEYDYRYSELKRLVCEMELSEKVSIVDSDYSPDVFMDRVKGLENEPEGGERCMVCYEMRLREAAVYAAQGGFDYFTTTLSISPLKNAQKINEIGEKLGREYNVKHLPSDFKKKEGYKQSVELSAQYDLYRQNFCGCVYSKREV